MPNRSSNRKTSDPNVAAYRVMQHVIAMSEGREPPANAKEQPAKNPAAVALGRLGGLKGGKARAKSLSASKRKAIAKKAAMARWRGIKSRRGR
jgi:hypothetical protein